MSQMSLILAFGLILLGSTVVAQNLPVKIYETGKKFRGSDTQPVLRVNKPLAVYYYVNGYKVGGRPWADAMWRKVTPEGTKFLSRTYDCAAGTWRNLGEGRAASTVSLSIEDLETVRDREARSGTAEFALAKFACGL